MVRIRHNASVLTAHILVSSSSVEWKSTGYKSMQMLRGSQNVILRIINRDFDSLRLVLNNMFEENVGEKQT